VERVYEATDDAVRVDAAQMGGAILNIALNALDAMPDGGILRIHSAQVDGRITLRVSDTGSGIAAAAKEEIFRPFYTTKEMGTGLGLPLARRAAQDAGGTLVLADAPADARTNGGAEFVLDLPRAQATHE